MNLNNLSVMKNAKKYIEENNIDEGFVELEFRYVNNNKDGMIHLEYSTDDLVTIHTIIYSGSSGFAAMMCNEFIDCYEDFEYADDEWVMNCIVFETFIEHFTNVDSTRIEQQLPDCPYGSKCYRKCKTHFEEYKHLNK
jgi:hypothetical protein